MWTVDLETQLQMTRSHSECLRLCQELGAAGSITSEWSRPARHAGKAAGTDAQAKLDQIREMLTS